MTALLEGFGALFTLEIALCILAGAAVGMLVGAFPGISATMAVALASAFTLTMEPLPGLAVLLTILVAAQFGDRVPAILINTPGTPASIATTFDGYALARQGKAGIALTSSAYASAIGGFVGIAVLMAAAIPLSELALEFGSPEMFALVVFGLTMMIEVSGGKIVKGLIAGLFGLALGTIGRDPLDGSDRFTFGIPELVEGIPFIAVIIGLFGITEVFNQMLERGHTHSAAVTSFGRWWPNKAENRAMVKPVAIGSAVGTVVGILPAAGGDIGGIVAWDQARRFSKEPELFGKGSLEGLTAADSSSNAGVGGSVLTTLALGVPGDSVMAVMLGSMIIWGIQPGPSLFSQQPDLVYSIAGIMIFATVLTLGDQPAAHARGGQAPRPAQQVPVGRHRDLLHRRHLRREQQRLRRGHDGAVRDRRPAVPPVRVPRRPGRPRPDPRPAGRAQLPPLHGDRRAGDDLHQPDRRVPHRRAPSWHWRSPASARG